MVVRLQDIWAILPLNHNVQLKVKHPDRMECYIAREVNAAWEKCPQARKLARVLSVYALTTETIEITVEETIPERGV